MTTRVPHLTRSEVAALEAARSGPLFATQGGWRKAGGRRFALATVANLLSLRFLQRGAGRVSITDAGLDHLHRLTTQRRSSK